MGTNTLSTVALWLGVLRRQWPMLLFMAGPAAGILLVAVVFGLPRTLWLMGAIMLIFAALLIVILLRADIRSRRSRAR
ncbi:MAG: hypothetical protein ACP5M1_08900 [Acidiphilium sp.]